VAKHTDSDNLFRYGLDVKARTVRLSGTVNSDAADCLAASLALLERAPGEITVFINSSGGYVYDGLACYDLLRACRNAVCTVGQGRVMSMAALILQAGDRRELSPNATVMLHENWMSLGDSWLADVKIEAAELDRLWGVYAGLVAPRIGITPKQFKRWYQRNTYLDPKGAVAAGLADRVRERP
jgi:ATP-dependent Clp protease protease subunit